MEKPVEKVAPSSGTHKNWEDDFEPDGLLNSKSEAVASTPTQESSAKEADACPVSTAPVPSESRKAVAAPAEEKEPQERKEEVDASNNMASSAETTKDEQKEAIASGESTSRVTFQEDIVPERDEKTRPTTTREDTWEDDFEPDDSPQSKSEAVASQPTQESSAKEADASPVSIASVPSESREAVAAPAEEKQRREEVDASNNLASSAETTKDEQQEANAAGESTSRVTFQEDVVPERDEKTRPTTTREDTWEDDFEPDDSPQSKSEAVASQPTQESSAKEADASPVSIASVPSESREAVAAPAEEKQRREEVDASNNLASSAETTKDEQQEANAAGESTSRVTFQEDVVPERDEKTRPTTTREDTWEDDFEPDDSPQSKSEAVASQPTQESSAKEADASPVSIASVPSESREAVAAPAEEKQRREEVDASNNLASSAETTKDEQQEANAAGESTSRVTFQEDVVPERDEKTRPTTTREDTWEDDFEPDDSLQSKSEAVASQPTQESSAKEADASPVSIASVPSESREAVAAPAEEKEPQEGKEEVDASNNMASSAETTKDEQKEAIASGERTSRVTFQEDVMPERDEKTRPTTTREDTWEDDFEPDDSLQSKSEAVASQPTRESSAKEVDACPVSTAPVPSESREAVAAPAEEKEPQERKEEVDASNTLASSGETTKDELQEAKEAEDSALSIASSPQSRETPDSVATAGEVKETKEAETETACSHQVPEGERQAAATLVQRIALRIALKQEEKPRAQPRGSSSSEQGCDKGEEDAFWIGATSNHPSPLSKGDPVGCHPKDALSHEEADASPVSMANVPETDIVATAVEAKEPHRMQTREAVEAACSQQVSEGERQAAAALLQRITLRVALKLEGWQGSSNSQSGKSDTDQEAATVLEFTGTPVNLGAWEDDYVDDFEDELVRAASTPAPGEVKEYVAQKVEEETVEESGQVRGEVIKMLHMFAFDLWYKASNAETPVQVNPPHAL